MLRPQAHQLFSVRGVSRAGSLLSPARRVSPATQDFTLRAVRRVSQTGKVLYLCSLPRVSDSNNLCNLPEDCSLSRESSTLPKDSSVPPYSFLPADSSLSDDSSTVPKGSSVPPDSFLPDDSTESSDCDVRDLPVSAAGDNR